MVFFLAFLSEFEPNHCLELDIGILYCSIPSLPLLIPLIHNTFENFAADSHVIGSFTTLKCLFRTVSLDTPSVNESIASSNSIVIRVNIHPDHDVPNYANHYSTVRNGMRYEVAVESKGDRVRGIYRVLVVFFTGGLYSTS